ncbi:MAG: LacI family transcriptional regulator [Cytophagales bacterium]|nr:LacI family transcriptional regulator [Cytophagales bacterium]
MVRRKRQITIKDLARKLDISVSTVSRALRAAPDVNPETKKRVLALAEELNYEPNVIASSLVNKRTRYIGVIVPELAMNFFSQAISEIQHEARKAGYQVMICQSDESYETEVEHVEGLIRSRVDGLIVSCSRETKDFTHFKKLIDKDIPLVFFDRMPSEPLTASSVIVDDFQGAYQATRHLIEQGCKRILHLSGPENLFIAQQRKKGFLKAVEDEGREDLLAFVLPCDALRQDAEENTCKALEDIKPDGIFAISDPVALQVLGVLKEKRISVPEQIKLVGFTDEPYNHLLSPALSSVCQPADMLGKRAAQIVLEQIEAYFNDISPKINTRTELVDTELRVRASSCSAVFDKTGTCC